MKLVDLFFLVALLVSCVAKQENSSNHIRAHSESTAYEFPELEIPNTFYLDSISIYDSISDASYHAYFPQSSLSQLKIFNRKIIETLKALIQLEQSYIEPCDGKTSFDCGYSFDLRPVAFYSDERLISITNVVDTYGAGGNHHNYAWFTFNFDIKRNERIRFQDVFNLPSRADSVAFVESVLENSSESCIDGWGMPFDSVDFSFADSGIYINPELSWACAQNRSLLSMDSLRLYVRGSWMEHKQKISYRIETIRLASKVNCSEVEGKTSCATITIRYPVFTGISKPVQDRVQKYFAEPLTVKDQINTLLEVAQNYIREGEANPYAYTGERDWFVADLLPQQISDTLITVAVMTDFWAYGHYDNRETTFIHFNPANGYRYKNLIERIDPRNNLRVDKLCPWPVDQYIDSGKASPRPITTMYFPIEYVRPQVATDSAFKLKATWQGKLVECNVKAGTIRIMHPGNYYRGSDAIPDYSDGTPHFMPGIKKFDLRINGKRIPVSLDYVVHPHIRDITFMSDILTKKLFIEIWCGDGAGIGQILLVVENGKLTGHYDWEYGYQHWKPYNHLDSFQFQKNDSCQIYYMNVELNREK